MNKKIIFCGLLTLATTMLLGCNPLRPLAGKDYKKPQLYLPTNWSVTLPNNRSQSLQSTSCNLANWWQQLGDPTLDQLINEAVVSNLDLRLAAARLRQARATRSQAISGLFPTLSAAIAADNKNASGVNTPTASTVYNAGFDASWELDIFGGIRRGIEAATADQAASEANLSNARVSLVAEVALNYIDVRSFQQRMAIAKNNLASQAETLQIAQWRYQAGLVTNTDVEQARTNFEQTRATIPDLEIGQTTAENRIAVLLGRSPGSLHNQLSGNHALPPIPATFATGIPADVLTHRPDLIAAERTLAAETARVGQKLAARFPSLNLDASFGWQAYSLAALGSASTLARAISGTLAATLFDGGKLRSEVEIQNAIQEQALISYQSTVLTALEEVENALKSYAVGRERVAARRAAADAARNAAKLLRNLYQSGLADFQTVLETERTQLNAENDLITAEATMRTSLITLYKALGGGWEQKTQTIKNQLSGNKETS